MLTLVMSYVAKKDRAQQEVIEKNLLKAGM